MSNKNGQATTTQQTLIGLNRFLKFWFRTQNKLWFDNQSAPTQNKCQLCKNKYGGCVWGGMNPLFVCLERGVEKKLSQCLVLAQMYKYFFPQTKSQFFLKTLLLHVFFFLILKKRRDVELWQKNCFHQGDRPAEKFLK